MSKPLPGEGALLAALDRALEAAATRSSSVGVVTLREAGATGSAARLASAALQVLPSDGVVGQLSPDRVALVLPGFGAAAARDFAQSLATTFPNIAVGSAASEPERPPCGPADLIAAAEASSEAGRLRILVVEDEPELAQILEAFLVAAGGFEVVVAHSGSEALARCAEAPPSLLLVDLELPDIDGAQLVKRIREQVRDLPAVACSGKRPESAAGAGFTAFFRKPFDMRALVAEVDRLLRTQALGVP